MVGRRFIGRKLRGRRPLIRGTFVGARLVDKRLTGRRLIDGRPKSGGIWKSFDIDAFKLNVRILIFDKALKYFYWKIGRLYQLYYKFELAFQ